MDSLSIKLFHTGYTQTIRPALCSLFCALCSTRFRPSFSFLSAAAEADAADAAAAQGILSTSFLPRITRLVHAPGDGAELFARRRSDEPTTTTTTTTTTTFYSHLPPISFILDNPCLSTLEYIRVRSSVYSLLSPLYSANSPPKSTLLYANYYACSSSCKHCLRQL